jgi:pimeloyl-ACP methyl ester carboxylesterase
MRILKVIVLGFAGILLLIGAGVSGALGYRAYRQHQNGEALAIHTPSGIDEATFIRVSGAEEWITLRGDNKDNPVILFLHGGPSEANSPFADFYRPFEKDFVFVQWDQPGAGKTYIRAGNHQPPLSIDAMAADGIAVAEYLKTALHKPNIILAGQDWGGLLGIRMIEKRPDLFSAFVGTGQIVSLYAAQDVQYETALARATASHDEPMLKALRQTGPPPYLTLESYGQFQECCRNPLWPADDVEAIKRMKGALVITPSLSIREIYGWLQGLRSGEQALDRKLLAAPEDLRKTERVFSVPVFFIQGDKDNVTPTALVADYLSVIVAPAKKIDVVPNAGHFVMWTHPAEFLNLLREDLRSAALRRNAEH